MEQYILPLTVNGMTGRVAHLPAPKEGASEVVFVYGHHSSIERWWGILELFNSRYAVTMPDLPGFGGMDSLYKLGKPATIDNLADYLADWFRGRYGKKRVTLIGMSLGFVVITRMLQRHPDLTANVSKLVSLFGFAHTDDFVVPAKQRRVSLQIARLFSLPVFSNLYSAALLNRFVLSRTYHKTPNAREKFKGMSPEEHRAAMEFEIGLWQNDDLRTYMKTSSEFLTLDNTRVRVNLPVYHIAVARDRYFDNTRVQKHFSQIFSSVHIVAELQNSSHAPTRVATAKEAKQLIPPELLQTM